MAAGGDQEEPDPGAGWKRRWLIDLGQAILMAVGLVIALGVGLMLLYNSMPHGELGGR